VHEADRDRLVKILRMFSSSHDGEVAAAARRAHELVCLRSLDWDDLIIPVKAASSSQQQQRRPDYSWSPPPPPPSPEEDETFLIRRCGERTACLSGWEKEFIASIGESIVEWGHLTPKQRSVLDRIVNKLKLRGVWDDI
jgi:hypothetical protein